MLLRLEDFCVPMKLVFRLEDRLRDDPERVRLAQALTLDSSRPRMGLRGTHGLFGSPEWWASIREGEIPLIYQNGIVLRAYVAGQEPSTWNNTIDLELDDGSVRMTGIYVNNKNDTKLFCPGCRVGIVYALDELKQQPAIDGGVNYLHIALEMAVSING
ncbi:hypothetical protein HI806_26615 (plasmid) [Ralstonia solanacearum]|nr:hypothetical protein RSOE_07065 [Ralstonia solanacearum OE1-1]AXV72679.1 hypothetical protein CJO74_24885 [Ralstonia solanacearum]MCK4150576.1 hypothetical protein [Ralstonia pseudosolanacearum]AXV99166.1 hypothetical protein CJO80_26130 [Ralstonia solanacearum]AXW04359.1 hypothetical protein CJO81_26055 [Ralstonia solanacearum]